MRRILIATPALDQHVNCYYAHSLCESIKLGLKNDLDINAVFLSNESILPMARNELFNLAYQQNYDAMVFVDSDQSWQAQHLINILLMDQPVISIPVVNKTDEKKEFNVIADKSKSPADNGLVPALKSGTGFLKLDRRVIEDLWHSNVALDFRGRQLKMICEYGAQIGSFVGEDIMLSQKILELGYEIWIYPDHTVSHIGNKMYTGTWTHPGA